MTVFRTLDQYDSDRVLMIIAKLVEVEPYLKEHLDDSILKRVESVGGSLEDLEEQHENSSGATTEDRHDSSEAD